MYRLRIESTFDAAHKLIGYKGKCTRLHGHTWKIEIFVIGNKLNTVGMLIDFGDLKKKLTDLLDNLDHRYLNDLKEIGNPTSENISKYIFKNLGVPKGIKLEKVRVWEGSGSWCEYVSDKK